MSGGVDSSVAAALLVAQGYDVTGAFMVNYGASLSELRPTSSGNEFIGCGKGDEFTGRSAAETCWTGDYQDALRVAAKLGIPLMRLDLPNSTSLSTGLAQVPSAFGATPLSMYSSHALTRSPEHQMARDTAGAFGCNCSIG